MQPKPSRSLVQNNTHKPLVLVVENDSTSRSLMQVMLTQNNLGAVLAADHVEAFAQLQNQRVRAAVIGTLMSGMSGTEVCKAIRAMPTYTNVPIVMILSTQDPAVHDRARQAGADGILIKPVIALELVELLRDLLRRG